MILLINIISNYSTGSELDYYLLKETTDAAIGDAIDVKYYRDNGALRLDKDKFVENFLRRFADSIDNTRNYTVSFYDINEVPPKVSVKVESDTVLSAKGENLSIITSYDAIVESTVLTDIYLKEAYNNPNNELGKPITSDNPQQGY